MQRIVNGMTGKQLWPHARAVAITRDRKGRFATLWSQTVHFISWLWRMFKIAVVIFAILAVGYGTSEIYHLSNTVSYVAVPQALAPVMDRIAKAESGNTHIAKNGQVLVHVNKNMTTDVGVYQVNLQIWGATATKLGYDLFNEKDNRAFALWLYENKGTEPWTSSSKNW